MAKDGAYFITDSLAQHMLPVELPGKKLSGGTGQGRYVLSAVATMARASSITRSR